jgi:hypothetical protein
MALEPTDEQIREICVAWGDWSADGEAQRVFALIRDMVLESAAKACEGRASTVDDHNRGHYYDCADTIRAMRGTP